MIVAKRCPVKSKDVPGRLLIFEFVEERIRHVKPFVVQATLIGAALGNLGHPEIKASLIRLAAQKIQIVLKHKEVRVRIIEGIRRRCRRVIVGDRYQRRIWRA